MSDELEWFQQWFSHQCEVNRGYGQQDPIRILTTEHPGWFVYIPLAETVYEAAPLAPLERQTDERNWLRCRVRQSDLVFEGYGGPGNLKDILRVFRDWCEGRHD